ncbi:MAG: hypothetical protein GY828_07870 [Candidatus Gracilibacteria bacterium]|nr:hypothetical protein [Candidatus Gracilibacteria bacterium]
MNTFSGTITFENAIDTSKLQEKNLTISQSDSEKMTLFVFGKTKEETSEDLIKSYENLGTIFSYDVSISTEDNIVLLNTDFEKTGIYEVAAFESPEITLRDVVERFSDSFEAMCVREAEESDKFGNRIIKVDFVY